MDVMTRPRPPYLHRVTTRHGKMVWYVRPGVGARKRIRLRSNFGTEEFRLEYQAALAGQPRQEAKGAPQTRDARLADRSLSRGGRMDGPLSSHPPAAGKHFQARPRERGRQAVQLNHEGDHHGRHRTAIKDASSGQKFSENNARAVQLGSEGEPH